ncbi:MAG: hotdog fold domain-containing protein [Oligoflexales bacterium]
MGGRLVKTIDIFNKLSLFPYGNKVFTTILCRKAPYFGSIAPTVQDLRPSFASATIRNTKKVQNHMGSVHAIAMCNMAELVGGLMTEVSIPSSKRWIPSGMSVEYLKKAKSDLRAIANGESINWSQEGSAFVPVEIKDTKGDLVFRARIEMRISTKPSRKNPKD